MSYRAGSTAQRVRIGLTGLAFAFLLVLTGSIVSRSGRDKSPESIENTVTNTPKEPLAELGVAPGSDASESDQANNSADQ